MVAQRQQLEGDPTRACRRSPAAYARLARRFCNAWIYRRRCRRWYRRCARARSALQRGDGSRRVSRVFCDASNGRMIFMRLQDAVAIVRMVPPSRGGIALTGAYRTSNASTVPRTSPQRSTVPILVCGAHPTGRPLHFKPYDTSDR